MRATLLLLTMLATLAAAGADPLVGRWKINGDGAMIDIRQSDNANETFDIVWIDGPDLEIEPETVIGTATKGAESGIYDCRITEDPRRSDATSRKLHDIAIKLDNDDSDTFVFHPYERNRRITLWRWIPYLFRISVTNPSNIPQGLEGARRVKAPKTHITI